VSEPALGAKAPAKAQLVRGRNHADRSSSDQGEVGDVRERGPQSDHLLDALGTSLRENLGQQAASAVADQRHRFTVPLLDLGHLVPDARKHVLRVECVDVDPRQVRAVADSLQPAM